MLCPRARKLSPSTPAPSNQASAAFSQLPNRPFSGPPQSPILEYCFWFDVIRVVKVRMRVAFFKRSFSSDLRVIGRVVLAKSYFGTYRTDCHRKALTTKGKYNLILLVKGAAMTFLKLVGFQLSCDRLNIGSHRSNLIFDPQLTIRVSSSTSFSEREGFKKEQTWGWGFWPWL